MSSPTHIKEKSSHSDPSVTPFRTSPDRVTLRHRAHSLSPRKKNLKQPLHIRLNLTETQMDKITEAFTYKVNGTPKRSQGGVDGTPSKPSHRRNKSSLSRPQTNVSYEGTSDYSAGGSTTFSELMPVPLQHVPAYPSLAERRQKETPSPIRVNHSKPAASLPRRPNMESVVEAVSPLEGDSETFSGEVDDYRVSHYSYDGYGDPELRSPTSQAQYPRENDLSNSGLGMYSSWSRLSGPFNSPDSTPHPQTSLHNPHRTHSIIHGAKRRSTAAELVTHSPQATAHHRVSYIEKESPLFSPLPLYFRGQDFPSIKKGEKTLIGQNGWLERTGNPPLKEKRSPHKKGGIIDSIKKIAKDMTELHYSNRRLQTSSKEPLGTNMAVSLDSREQSLLYCELEFHLTNALNEFIISELDRGHLDPDKLKKIADAWHQFGRPRVVGFRYDLETQLELVSLHIDEFVFYGRRQGNPTEIVGLLQAMKTNARAIAVRTFCQPDSVIAKQLVDAQSLFNLINAGEIQQLALAEIAQFFKVIIEREVRSNRQKGRDTPQ